MIRRKGFLQLREEVILGLKLNRGAWYGDMMHFDLRNKGNGAKIQGMVRAYQKEKEDEAAAAWAKANP